MFNISARHYFAVFDKFMRLNSCAFLDERVCAYACMFVYSSQLVVRGKFYRCFRLLPLSTAIMACPPDYDCRSFTSRHEFLLRLQTDNGNSDTIRTAYHMNSFNHVSIYCSIMLMNHYYHDRSTVPIGAAPS